MNPAIPRNANKAFTLIELLVVVAIVAILAAMLLPALTDRGHPTKTIGCMSNLRQVNLALILSLSDHGDQFPWQVSTNNGGTEELVERGIAADHFLKLTNYLRQPSILLCPFETARVSADSFTRLSNTNLSYFVALITITNNSWTVALTGDRHLSFDDHPIKPGLFLVTSNATLGWTPELHVIKNPPTRGNLAFADGHADSVNAVALTPIFRRQTIATNRLVIP